MNKNRKSFIKAMLGRTLIVAGIFGYGIILTMNPVKLSSNTVSNINNVRSIEAYHMIDRYDNREKKLEVLHVETMAEAKEYGALRPISFTGQMTAYKATCTGCTGIVACPPRQDVRGDNIWYNEPTYGKIRIMAADRNIPCGTLVKITNVSFTNEEIIGIVLDRGGAIKGNIMDFLVGPDEDMDMIGRQRGVNYEVLRWGW